MTRYSKRAPNGITYTVEGPPGATDDQVIAEIVHQNPEAAQARQAPATRAEAKAQGKPRSWLDTIGSTVRGAVGGAGDLVELGMTANPITGISRVIGDYLPEGKVKNVVRALAPRGEILANAASDTLKLPTAETDNEKLLAAGARGAVGALAPGGGLKGLATGVVSGIASGLAGEKVRQMDYGPGAQIAAALAAGLVPSNALRAGKETLAKGAEYVGERGANIRARRRYQSEAVDKNAAIRALEQEREAIPGSSPLTAERAGDAGLAAFQRQRDNTAIQTQQRQNAIARAQAVEGAAGGGDIGAVKELGTRVQRREEAARAADVARQEAAREAALTQAHGEREAANVAAQLQKEEALKRAQDEYTAAQKAAREGVGSQADVEVSGNNLRKLAVSAYDSAKTHVAGLYAKLAPFEKTPVTVKDETLDGIFKDTNVIFGEGADPAGAKLREIMNEFVAQAVTAKAGGKQTTAEFVTNMDRRLADLSMDVKGNQRAFIGKVRERIDKEIRPQMGKEFNTLYDEAKAGRARQGEIFESRKNVVSDILKKEDFNRFATPDELLPEKLVARGPAGRNVANRLIAAVGKDASEPLVREQVRRLIDEGVLTSSNVKRFEYLLGKYPKIQAHVKGLHDVEALHTGKIKEVGIQQSERVKEVAAQQEANVKQVSEATKVVEPEDLFTPTALGQVAAGKEGAVQGQISGLLKNNDGAGLRELVKRVKDEGDPEALAGVQKALAEHIKEAGGNETDLAGNVIPNVKNTRDALELVLRNGRKALTPEQRTVLKSVHAELKGARAVETAGVVKGEKPMSAIVPTATGLGTRLLRFAQQHFINQNKMDEFINKAILDPKFALELLKRPTPDRKKAILDTLARTALGSAQGAQQFVQQPVQ